MLLRFIIFSLFLTLLSTAVMACQCMAPSDELSIKSWNTADVVVRATVISASSGWGSSAPIVKLNIHDVLKGDDVPDIITADYNVNAAACGNSFEEGDNVVIALYDTRSLMVTDANTRGYGFRVMISCHQNQVRHYVDTMMDKAEIKEIQTEKEK